MKTVLTLALAFHVALFGLPADAQTSDDLTIELIDGRLSALRDAGAGDEDETVRTYSEARAFLSEAELQNQDLTRFTEALTTAAAREAEIQARLDAFDQDSDPLAELQGLSDAERQERLPSSKAELAEANTRLDVLDRRFAARNTNADNIRSRLAEIAQRIDALPDEGAPLVRQASPSLAEARQIRNDAEVIALGAERRALEARLASQPIRYSALAAERAELSLSATRLAAVVRELESATRDDQAAVLDLAALGVEPDDVALPLVVELISIDAERRQDLLVVNGRLTEVRSEIEAIGNLSRSLKERFATAQRVVSVAADSVELGRALLAFWAKTDSYSVADPTIRWSGDVSSTVVRRLAYEEALAQLVSARAFVNRSLRDAGTEPDAVSEATRATLIELARGYRDRLRAIVAAQSEYIDALSTLDAAYASHSQLVREYRGYLERLILWIPNHPPLWQVDIDSVTSEIAAALGAFAGLEVSFRWTLIAGLLVFVLLLSLRPKVIAYQGQLNQLIARPRDDSILYTLLAVGCVATRALPLPALILAASTLLTDQGSGIARELAQLATRLAIALFLLLAFRHLCEPRGVARVHFAWRESTAERSYREIGWLIGWWLPVAAVAVFVNAITPDVGDAIITRALLLIPTVMLIVHLTRNIRWREAETGARWHQGGVNTLGLMAMALLGVIGLAFVTGFVFSVTIILAAASQTVYVGLAALLLHAILKRWLSVARRHLRMNQLLARPQTELLTVSGETIEAKETDLGEISSETLQLVNVSVIAGLVLALLFIWAPLLPAFEAFERVTLWTSTTVVDGETFVDQVTLATLIMVVALLGLTLYAARKLPALVELILQSRTGVSQGARYATSTLLNYAIVGTGIIAALATFGLQWSKLQWLVAALGVGIGFGLQEIVANFISGLIILFERPIRVGDIVTMGDKDGTVTKIRIRATTLRDFDGKELLVPNKEFITGRLLNWTLSDMQTRLVIPVGIAYGSDVELALRTLMEVISRHPATLDDPAPSVLFLGFGDSSLNLVARCFVGDMKQRMPTTSELHTEINRAFKEAGIVIAFPQRDVHVDGLGPIQVNVGHSGER